jgi:hypothetical protein
MLSKKRKDNSDDEDNTLAVGSRQRCMRNSVDVYLHVHHDDEKRN